MKAEEIQYGPSYKAILDMEEIESFLEDIYGLREKVYSLMDTGSIEQYKNFTEYILDFIRSSERRLDALEHIKKRLEEIHRNC